MRSYLEIQLDDQRITRRELQGEEILKAGRYLIARTLVELNVAQADALGPQNPLIFSAGPLAGTVFSNANRTSVGCKSPLTGGVKEANGGGNFAYALGQLQLAGLTLHGISPEWTVLYLARDGAAHFESAEGLLGLGNYAAAEALYARYGRKVALALCGPVGEYQGLLAGIAFSDKEGRPARLAARGGVGAVMGSKRVKAIVVDLERTPPLHDPKKVGSSIKEYVKLLRADSIVMDFYNKAGTMAMADLQNFMGGLPVNNFSAGAQADVKAGEPFRMGADFIGELNTSRGGEQTHACMPGCAIQCSNIYVDAQGKELVSPVEYETLGLLGTNCGLTHPDDLAGLNYICNDLGIDTIEVGGTLGVLMEAGLAAFGDAGWMAQALAEIRAGSELGRCWAQGTARVAEQYGVARAPVIKKQAISAYDPRVVEATGVTMMTTAQGADHTAGNLPRLNTRGMELAELKERSLAHQVKIGFQDSIGLCIFGGTVTLAQLDFLAEAINAAHGTQIDAGWFTVLGQDVLRYEKAFNVAAGFGAADDELPAFFYSEPLPPTQQAARFHGDEVHNLYEPLGWEQVAGAEMTEAVA